MGRVVMLKSGNETVCANPGCPTMAKHVKEEVYGMEWSRMSLLCNQKLIVEGCGVLQVGTHV